MRSANPASPVEQSQFEAAKAAFFLSGGKVDLIDGFKFEPRPARIEPVISEQEIERRAFAEKVREMGRDMGQRDIAAALKVSADKVYQACKRFSISCKSGRGRKSGSSGVFSIDPAVDAPMAERLRAMAEIGVTKGRAEKVLGIGSHRMSRLIETYGIEFKRTRS